MGKQHGMKLGSENTYSDIETQRMRDQRYNEGYADGYKQGKHSGITNKEIPGEYLSHIEEAFGKGYKEGYDDCREITKMLNKYGRDKYGVE